jgi:hypothetical protein
VPASFCARAASRSSRGSPPANASPTLAVLLPGAVDHLDAGHLEPAIRDLADAIDGVLLGLRAAGENGVD